MVVKNKLPFLPSNIHSELAKITDNLFSGVTTELQLDTKHKLRLPLGLFTYLINSKRGVHSGL